MSPTIPTINTSSDGTSSPRWPGFSAPPSPSSPLTRPPLLPETPTDLSPSSTSLRTPDSTDGNSIYGGPYFGSVDASNLKSDHSLLASMATSPDPYTSGVTNGNTAASLGPRHSFPLLPPHHPLRNKMQLEIARDKDNVMELASPPTTPKGHPIESSEAIRFPKGKTHPISNPYSRGYARLPLSRIRVPRRHRPVLVFCVCAFIFGLVWLNNSIVNKRQLETYSQQQASALSRRQAQMLENREANRQVYIAQLAEQAMQAAHSAVAGPPLTFENSREEFAALIAFVTSTTANALPHVDPSLPLDPSVVLDFDPTRSGAREDLDLLVSEVNTIYPLVLMGKMRDPWHREVKRMLAEYKITPAPLIIDVDQRRDHRTFIPLVARILGTEELPQLVLDGKPIGSYHQVLEMKENDTFASLLEEQGMLVSEAKKKKKGVKERERLENERILGPAPIRDE